MKIFTFQSISKLRVFFYYVLYLGIEPTKLNHQRNKVLKLTNFVHLSLVLALFIFGIVCYLHHIEQLCLVHIFWCLVNVFCLYLNKKKKFSTSKSIFLVTVQVYILTLAFVINIKELALNMLILSAVIALFMHKRSEYVKIALFYLLSVANYLIIKNSPVAFNLGLKYSEQDLQWIGFAGFAMSSVVLILMIYAQKVIGEQNEFFLLNEIRQRRKVENALAVAKKSSDKSSLVKADFLSTISYHIRTPLNSILGLSNLLLLESPKKTQLPKLAILKSSIDTIIHLIDNLLDFNKIESGDINIHYNEFHIKEVIESICKSYYLKAQERNNKFTVEIDKNLPITLVGDEIKISQVVGNLLSNAFKFTEKGSVKLEVKLKTTMNGHASVYFSVSDTGIGIAKEKLKYVFENFATNLAVNGRNYTTSGSGLGLSISKRLVEVIGSEIFVESNLGKGAKFYFTLNLKILEEMKAINMNDIVAKSKNLNEIRILLVDDNRMNLVVADSFLKRWNATVDTAEDGITAVELARNTPYDIILMDLQLPQISGFEATKQIRTFNENVAILALTAENYGLAHENFNLLGINDVLLKPFYPDDLYAKIEALLGEKLGSDV